MRKFVLAFFALALLLSACRIESNILLDINEDGSATVGAEVGFDEEMLDLISQGGGDLDDLLTDLPDLGGDDVEPINRTEGDMTYVGATTHVDDLSTYDFGGLQGETFSEFSYEYDASTATLSATVDASGLGDLGGAEDLPIDPSEITGDILSARVLIKMPGTVSESNADEVLSDGTLAWDLPFTGTKEIVATSNIGGSGLNWIWFVVGAILLIGIGAAIAAVVMSKRDSETAVAAAAAAYEEPTSHSGEGTGDGPQAAGDSEEATDDSGEESGARPQATEDSEEQTSDSEEPNADSEEQPSQDGGAGESTEQD